MAEEQEIQEEEAPKKSGMSTVTLIGVIAGVVVLQVIIVFVIFKVFMAPSGGESHSAKDKKEARSEVAEDEPEEESEEDEEVRAVRVKEVKEIVATEDLILNPRGSSSRYVMLALGLEVDDPEAAKHVEEKLLIPVQHTTRLFIGQYSIQDLERITLIDSLPGQLKKKLQPYFGEHKLRNVYFKKFIIQ